MPSPPSDPKSPSAGRRFAPIRWAVAGGTTGFLIVFVLRLAYIFLADNAHTVLPNQVYRTAQLTPPEMERLFERHHFRSVVNLRGCCSAFSWYLDEARVTHKHGVAQEDVCLSSGRMPSTSEVRRLVEVIDRSEYPIVFHCHRGIDRTGLATTMVLLLRTETSVAEARRQLGLPYGHLPFGKTGYMDQFFDLYEDWLAGQGAGHTPDTFRRWALEEYRPEECWAKLELTGPLDPISAEQSRGLVVRVTNTSARPWRMQSSRVSGIHLRFAVHDVKGVVLAAGHAGLFEAEVKPGESIDLMVALPPLPPGRHQLMMDMEEPGHCLFAQVGSEPLEVELIVND